MVNFQISVQIWSRFVQFISPQLEFFFNRNGQFFNLTSKFYIVCCTIFCPKLADLCIGNDTFTKLLYKFFPEFVYFSTRTYFFTRNLYNFQIWSRIVRFFSKEVAYFLIEMAHSSN